MKTKYLLLSAITAFGLSAGASAYTITGGTDVGGLDGYLAQTTGMSSGEATETAWAAGIVGTTLTFAHKSDPADLFQTLDDPYVVASEQYSSATFFLVRCARTHVPLQNEARL